VGTAHNWRLQADHSTACLSDMVKRDDEWLLAELRGGSAAMRRRPKAKSYPDTPDADTERLFNRGPDRLAGAGKEAGFSATGSGTGLLGMITQELRAQEMAGRTTIPDLATGLHRDPSELDRLLATRLVHLRGRDLGLRPRSWASGWCR